MKRSKKVGFTLAFLDVLSNAMAAVLILTLVRLAPNPLGEGNAGYHFVRLSRIDIDSRAVIRLGIEVAPLQTIREDWDHSSQDVRIKTELHAANAFYINGERNAYFSAFAYLERDMLEDGGECLLLDVNLPNVRFQKNIWLTRENYYALQFLEAGRPTDLLDRNECPPA